MTTTDQPEVRVFCAPDEALTRNGVTDAVVRARICEQIMADLDARLTRRGREHITRLRTWRDARRVAVDKIWLTEGNEGVSRRAVDAAYYIAALYVETGRA